MATTMSHVSRNTSRPALAELVAHISEIERRIGRWAAYIPPERKDEFTDREKAEAEREAEFEASVNPDSTPPTCGVSCSRSRSHEARP